MRYLALALSLLVVGCGSKDPITPPDAPDDAVVDSPVDSPPGAGNLVINDGTGTITQWTAPSTFVGTGTTARLWVVNTGAIGTGALTLVIAGPDATKFSFVGSNTCTQLVAGNMCPFDIRFSPTGAGAANAVLKVGDGTQHVDLPLAGGALIASGGGLVADVASVDFLPITRGDTATAQLILSNGSASTITLGARTTAAPFSITGDNCPATLTAGGACTVTLTFTGTTVGAATGMLHAASNANDVDVPLSGVVLRKINAGPSSFGTGSVVSLPVGIACPSTCSYGFPGGVTVAFTATAAAGNMFVQWGGLCSGTSCSVASPLDGTVSAQFVPNNAKKIAITMAGTSRGYAGLLGTGPTTRYGNCLTSCDIYVPMGAQVTAYGYSPSTFVGWSGDCTSSTDACNLGTIVADRAITLTTAADPDEVATLLPAVATTGLAIAANGNLIIGTSTGVSEITLAGTAVWSTAISGGATSLATDAAGHIYGLGGPGVFALTATGTMVWTRNFAGAPVRGGSLNSSVAASPDGTVIAVFTGDGVHVVDGSGVDRFTITGVSPLPQTVAVAPDGSVALSQDDLANADQSKALIWSKTGTPLTAFSALPGYYSASIVFDGTNALCGITTGRGNSTIFRVTSPGVTAFSASNQWSLSNPTGAAAAITSSGEVVGMRYNRPQSGSFPGVRLEVFSPTGTPVLTNIKATYEFAFGGFGFSLYAGVLPEHLASGGTNRIAISGVFSNGYSSSNEWIQVYDLP